LPVSQLVRGLVGGRFFIVSYFFGFVKYLFHNFWELFSVGGFYQQASCREVWREYWHTSAGSDRREICAGSARDMRHLRVFGV
jgi:hypothetical protein